LSTRICHEGERIVLTEKREVVCKSETLINSEAFY